MVLGVALYVAESWTILKTDRKKIEVFQNLVLKISKTERVSNEMVYRKI